MYVTIVERDDLYLDDIADRFKGIIDEETCKKMDAIYTSDYEDDFMDAFGELLGVDLNWDEVESYDLMECLESSAFKELVNEYASMIDGEEE